MTAINVTYQCRLLKEPTLISVRPRPHVSGDFCIRKFFHADTKYLRPHVAYTNRIRPSTRIQFVSGHLKGLVNRACALRLVLILWRQRIQKYTDTSVHTYPDTRRIQKFPLWRAYTEISGYTERIRRTRVDARCIRIKKFADTKISEYVWAGPKCLGYIHTIQDSFCAVTKSYRIVVCYTAVFSVVTQRRHVAWPH